MSDAPTARQAAGAGVTAVKRWWAIALVGATCVASLVLYRIELAQVPYLNDFAMHEEMVRFALVEIRSGHFPLSAWFPFLNLGSPLFLHYQGLGAMVTSLLGWLIGVDRAFRWVTWLLVCCWPLVVYAAGRLFGLGRPAASAAALLAPFISSATGVGYERVAYLWSGYGLWAQLFAMWTLPLAWACSWRAVEQRRLVMPAAVSVAATAAFHFETGYLAFLGVAVFVLARPRQLLVRLQNALVVGVPAFGLAAWAIVPLIAQGRWAAVNEFLQHGADADSYGARRVLSWLVDGGIFDWHHALVLTPLVLAGIVACLIRSARSSGAGPGGSEPARALVLVFLLSLALYFGRPTLGPLLDVLPGAVHLFFRRFIVGVQLAGLLLAGVGVEWLGARTISMVRLVFTPAGKRAAAVGERLAIAALALAALAALVPVWSFSVTEVDTDHAFVAQQRTAGRAEGELNALLSRVGGGKGRVFAGDPSDWGESFTVGKVPVYAYLASRNVDEVGFNLRTASLMSDPEVQFDETNPADYALFGIRFLVLPAGMHPPVPADRLEVRGSYALWWIRRGGYLHLVDTRGELAATSADLGAASASLLANLPPAHLLLPTVAYEGGRAAPASLRPGARPRDRPGRVITEHADLAEGRAAGEVSAARPAVVVLSASYDPGWQAFVDGRRAPSEMVAPALVGVRVPAGRHFVRFVYRGYPDYPQLFAVGAAATVVLLRFGRARRTRHASLRA